MRTRRRPRRTWRWEGCVLSVDGDEFTAELLPADHRGPAAIAEFDLARLPDAQPGDVFNLYAHRRGRKRRVVLRRRDLGRWAAQDLDGAQRAGRELAVRLRGLMD